MSETATITVKRVRPSTDKWVNWYDPSLLAQYLVELERAGANYSVIKESDGSHSVKITGI